MERQREVYRDRDGDRSCIEVRGEMVCAYS